MFASSLDEINEACERAVVEVGVRERNRWKRLAKKIGIFAKGAWATCCLITWMLA